MINSNTMPKILLSVLILVCFRADLLAQTISVSIPVGDDSLFYTVKGSIVIPAINCRHSDTCVYGWLSCKDLSSPFYADLGMIHVLPLTDSLYTDTVTVFYPNIGGGDCQCLNNITNSVRLEVKGYYDDELKIQYHPSPYFLYDTLSEGYKSTSLNFNFFNNKKDSVLFTDWKIINDSSQSVTLLTIVKDSLSVNQFWLTPLEQVNTIQLIFLTSLSPTLQYRFFPATIQCRAHFGSKDSLCVMPLHFGFQPMPKSGVTLGNELLNDIDIYPNPSKGITHAYYKSNKSLLLHLHVFNELGKDIMTVYDGMMNELHRDFSFKLSPGMYYVRMETAEGVVTKKLIVE